MMEYLDFLASKRQRADLTGFKPLVLPDWLFDFQSSLLDWSLRKGRSAIFADCVAAETIISGPDGDERIDVLARQGRPIRVWSLTPDQQIVASWAKSPFINGHSSLYRFSFSSGRSVTTTMGHRFLTPSGWRRGDYLKIGESLAVSSPKPRETNWEPSRLTAPEGDRHSSRTIPNCQGDCSVYFCPDDARLPRESGIGQSLPPSRDDARGRSLTPLRMDALVSRSERTHHRQSDALPSIDRFALQATTTGAIVGCPTLSFDRRGIGENSRTLQQAHEDTTLGMQVLEPHPSGGSRCEVFQSEPYEVSWDTLVAIQYIRDDVFYDMEVPGNENYFANGILSHNCGLGKGPMALVWADNVARKTNKPVLIATPLAVAGQFIREGVKFGIECVQSRDGKIPSEAKIVVTNYDQLHKFDRHQFSGAVADESGAIKNFDAKRTALVIEFFRELPYRLLCTATPAPNDYIEIGTSAEALGEMGFSDMITRFFRQQTSKDHLGWGRTKYLLRPHAKDDFWRWVCSWARAIRKPSDLGFDDTRFVLPPLTMTEHVIEARQKRDGMLFDMPAVTLSEEREERRRTIEERCEKVADLVNHDRPALVWCHLNPEGDLLTKLIPGAVQVSGADKDEAKEEKILAFISGEIRTIVSKPVVLGWGLNLQNCSHETFFPSHSFEQVYQSIRRCWRFGQKNPVQVDVVASEGERGVLENLKRKEAAATMMFQRLVELMHDHLNIRRSNPFAKEAEVPTWLDNKEYAK